MTITCKTIAFFSLSVFLLFCFSSCKKGKGTTTRRVVRVTENEKQILMDKLEKLRSALAKEDVVGIRNLMHETKKHEFTLNSIRQIEEFRGRGHFRIGNYKPDISAYRVADNLSLVQIEGLGVLCFFKEIDGIWYFNGWAEWN